jgi:flagellar basal-body rod protein FlgC
MDLSIAASGMQNAAARQRITANNLANVNTPGFQAARGVNKPAQNGGVRLAGVVRDPSPGPAVPSSGPDAVDGFTEGSNVDITREQADNIVNPRQMEANASVLKTQDDMIGTALDLLG